MDPNEALKQLREHVAGIMEEPSIMDPDVVEFAELFQSLDEWIAKGGFLPAPWVYQTIRGEMFPYKEVG